MSKKMFFSPIGGAVSPFLADLVGYYRFNSDANDFSGKNHNGTIVGSPTFSAGKVGNSIDFVNDVNLNCVTVPHTTDFNFSNGIVDTTFTISMWVRFHSLNVISNFFTKSSADTPPYSGYRFAFNGSLFFLKYQANNLGAFRYIYSASNPFVINTWYHICYTDNGIGNEKIYINGIEIATTKQQSGVYVTMGNNTLNANFGNANYNIANSNKHKGLIDEAYIWKNRVLTPTEVLEVYNKGLLGQTLI
jgi:hypothetical protein